MTGIVLFSVIAFVTGWLTGSARSIRFMERKFIAWLRMTDYREEDIKRIIEEMKGIIL